MGLRKRRKDKKHGKIKGGILGGSPHNWLWGRLRAIISERKEIKEKFLTTDDKKMKTIHFFIDDHAFFIKKFPKQRLLLRVLYNFSKEHGDPKSVARDCRPPDRRPPDCRPPVHCVVPQIQNRWLETVGPQPQTVGPQTVGPRL